MQPASHPTPQRVTHAELLGMVSQVLTANGFAEQVASPIARTVAACERDDVPSHGLLRLPGFVEAVRTGWADGVVLPSIVSESASMLVMDAHNGFTHLALDQAKTQLAGMARETGSAVLLIRNAHHFAALWPDIEDFAVNGQIAFSCVTSRARVTAWAAGIRHQCLGIRLPARARPPDRVGPGSERDFPGRRPVSVSRRQEAAGRGGYGCPGLANR